MRPDIKVRAYVAGPRWTHPPAWPAWAVTGGVVGADELTKAWVSHQVPTDPAVSNALFQVRHVMDAGATLGLGAQHPALVLGLALIATAVVAWYPATFNLADVAIRGGVLVAVAAHAFRRGHTKPGNPAAP